MTKLCPAVVPCLMFIKYWCISEVLKKQDKTETARSLRARASEVLECSSILTGGEHNWNVRKLEPAKPTHSIQVPLDNPRVQRTATPVMTEIFVYKCIFQVQRLISSDITPKTFFLSRGKAALQIAVYVCFCLSVSLFRPVTAFYYVPVTESLSKFRDPKRSYVVPRSNISAPPEPLFRKHGTANGWPWLLKWLEHSAWIRRLGVRVSLRSRHFLSQNLWHFHMNIRLCVENECCCPCTVKISNVDLDIKNICTTRASLKKTWDSKCMALAAQMVRAFGMNPKVRCSSFPQVETFYA